MDVYLLVGVVVTAVCVLLSLVTDMDWSDAGFYVYLAGMVLLWPFILAWLAWSYMEAQRGRI